MKPHRVRLHFPGIPKPSFAAAAFAVIAFSGHSVPAAVTEAWVQRHSSMANQSNDMPVAVVRDADNDIIVAGNSDAGIDGVDMLTIKYSGADGSVLWQRRYNNPAGGTNNTDQVKAVAVDGEGNVLVTGHTFSQTNGYGWYTAKYAAADGAVVWETNHAPGDSDNPASLAIDAAGDVIVSGFSQSPGKYETHLVKYAARDGRPVWTNVASESRESSSALAIDSRGDVVVSTRNRTAKYSGTDGARLWEKPVWSDRDTSLALDAAGNAVTGSAWTNDWISGYRLVKYAAADGAELWEKEIVDPGDPEAPEEPPSPEYVRDDPAGLALDGNGNVALARTSMIRIGTYAIHTARLAAADGSLVWEQRYRMPDHFLDISQAVAVDASGNVLVTGHSRYWHPGRGINTDMHTIKYAAEDGAVLWEAHYDGPAENSDDFPAALLVDGAGNVVVTGSSGLHPGSPDSLLDYHTAKYAAADGARLWESRYDAPAPSDDRAQAVAFDSAGNVIVTGYSAHDSLPAYGTDYYTAKYAAATGGLLWERRYDNGAFSFDQATGVAVDRADNVVVTGIFATIKYLADGTTAWIQPGSFNTALAVDDAGDVIVGAGHTYAGEIVIAKYAAADGALRWSSLRGTEYRYISAVGVDRDGNVIVTGAAGGDGSLDYYTAKFAGATGALIWDRRFDADGERDAATSLAVGPDGSVVVTGSVRKDSLIECGDSDCYTIKYAAANGAVLWERRYDPEYCSDEFANAVALDSAGNVLVTGSWTRFDAEGSLFGGSYTAKYAAGDGAVLWERSEANGTGPVALAVDDMGNAVVTGPTFPGFYTAKYAAADGTKLWSRGSRRAGAYAGALMGSADPLSPNPGTGDAHSLAIGPDGQIAITGSVDGNPGPRVGYDFETVLFRELPGPASFAAWAAGFGLSGESAAADADPDRDGLPNALEFVFGANPAAFTTPAISAAAAVSGDAMLVTFHRDDTSETPDISLTVESGTDLLTWPRVVHVGSDTASSAPGVTVVENGDAPDTVTVAIPIGQDNSKFVRLKVTISP